MIDLSRTVAPKSDQLNADDLIAGPRTIVVTAVKLVVEDQPAVLVGGVGRDLLARVLLVGRHLERRDCTRVR